MIETINKIKKESRIYLQETGKDASPEILAERLGMEVDKIKAIQEMNQEPISLETPVGSEEAVSYTHLMMFGNFLIKNSWKNTNYRL